MRFARPARSAAPVGALVALLAVLSPGAGLHAQTQYVWTDMRTFAAREVPPGHKAILAAADASPDSLHLVLAALRADVEQLRFREAIQRQTMAIQRWPDHAELHFLRAKSEFSLRRFDRSLRALDRSLSLDDRAFDAWMLLGEIWFASGAHADAVRAFDRARVLAADSASHAEATYWLWPALTRAGAFDPARRIVARDYSPTLVSDHARALSIYRGEVSPADVTPPLAGDTHTRLLRQFASAQHELVAGDTSAAHEMFGRALTSSHWASPAFVVAEREHSQMTAGEMTRRTLYMPQPPEADAPGAARLTCLATVPAAQTRRVLIRAGLRARWPDGADSVAGLVMERMAEHLDRAVTRLQEGMEPTASTVPTAEPKFTWLGISGAIEAQLDPNGRLQWRIVDADDAHVARSGRAIRALAAEIFTPTEANDPSRPWPTVAGTTPIQLRIAFTAPMVLANDVTLDTASNAVLIPAFSMRMPIARGAEIVGGVNIDVPRNSLTAGFSGVVLMGFDLDTLGRVNAASIEEIWNSPDPKPTGEAAQHYAGYVDAVRRWLQRSRWTPASLGGCRAPQRLQFSYRLYFVM